MPPTIAIVVPSFNQARYLGETLQSLVDQRYPALEIIVQDGGSTDASLQIAQDFAQRHPGLIRVFVEKDAGQADAINRGFARTRAEILGFLNSDDTLFAGTLARVAREIDPARGRYVVMGRCLFTGENSPYVGVEHPAEFVSHFDQLAIWRRGYNAIPQPSVFWHRSVWERCGPLDVNEHHALDYDLFCRISRHYVFHRVDELWSTYRMHDDSKSSRRTEAEVLALSIAVSRKHWGSWLRPLRWRCELSYWLYRRHVHDHARHHARRAEQAFRERRWLAAARELAWTFLFAPRMALVRLIGGWASDKRDWMIDLLLVAAPKEYVGRYPDGWIGPNLRETMLVPADASRLALTFRYQPWRRFRKRMRVELVVEGVVAAVHAPRSPVTFTLEADVRSWRERRVTVEVRCSAAFVPAELEGSKDRRRLAIRLEELAFRA